MMFFSATTCQACLRCCGCAIQKADSTAAAAVIRWKTADPVPVRTICSSSDPNSIRRRSDRPWRSSPTSKSCVRPSARAVRQRARCPSPDSYGAWLRSLLARRVRCGPLFDGLVVRNVTCIRRSSVYGFFFSPRRYTTTCLRRVA